MSEKNGKNVQTAKVKTQKKDKAPVDPLRQPIVIPENIRKVAKDFGVDAGQMGDYINLLRERVLGIEGAIVMMANGLDERDKKLEPLVNLAKQVEARRQQAISAPAAAQGAPQQGGGGIDIGGVIKEALRGGGGGGMDEEMANLTKELMRTSIDQVKQNVVTGAKRADADIALAEAIKTLVIRRVAAKTVLDVTE